jgi:hypothetical protein
MIQSVGPVIRDKLFSMYLLARLVLGGSEEEDVSIVGGTPREKGPLVSDPVSPSRPALAPFAW